MTSAGGMYDIDFEDDGGDSVAFSTCAGPEGGPESLVYINISGPAVALDPDQAKEIRGWLDGWLAEHGPSEGRGTAPDVVLRAVGDAASERVARLEEARHARQVRLGNPDDVSRVREHMATLRAAAVEHVTKKRNPARFQADGGVSLDDVERVHAWLAGMVAE